MLLFGRIRCSLFFFRRRQIYSSGLSVVCVSVSVSTHV